MKNDKGVTLIELIIVVSIIGILAVAIGFQFSGWMGKYNVESTIKQIQSDLVFARSDALQVRRNHYFRYITATNQYAIYDDDSDGTNQPLLNGDGRFQRAGDAGVTKPDSLLKVRGAASNYPKSAGAYSLNWNGGDLAFGSDGFIQAFDATTRAPILPPWTLSITSTFDPDYDCILVTNLKLNLGKMSVIAGVNTCVPK